MLDTDTCIYARKRPAGFEPRLPLSDCGVSIIVLGELEWGVARSRRVEENQNGLRDFLTASIRRYSLQHADMTRGRPENYAEHFNDTEHIGGYTRTTTVIVVWFGRPTRIGHDLQFNQGGVNVACMARWDGLQCLSAGLIADHRTYCGRRGV